MIFNVNQIDLSKKKILVTGGSGFLGSFVVEKLRERGVSEKNIFVPIVNCQLGRHFSAFFCFWSGAY